MLSQWLSILNYCFYFVKLMHHFLTILHLSQHICKIWKQQTNVQIMVPSQMNVANKHNSSWRGTELTVISKLGCLRLFTMTDWRQLANCSNEPMLTYTTVLKSSCTTPNLHFSEHCGHSSVSFCHSLYYAIKVFLPKLPTCAELRLVFHTHLV